MVKYKDIASLRTFIQPTCPFNEIDVFQWWLYYFQRTWSETNMGGSSIGFIYFKVVAVGLFCYYGSLLRVTLYYYSIMH